MFTLYKYKGESYNLNHIQIKKHRFYNRFHDHKSSLGNELIANIYFNALIGKKDFSLKVIRCYFKKSSYQFNKQDQTQTPKKAFQSIQIVTNGDQILATLKKDRDYSFNYKSNYTKQMRNFITFFDKSDFLRSFFIPTDIPLKNGMKIYVQWEKEKVQLGEIEALDRDKTLFVFYVKYMKYKTLHPYDDNPGPFFVYEEIPPAIKKQLGKITGQATLLVENYKLGKLYPDDIYGEKFIKFNPNDTWVMQGPFSYVREKHFRDTFSLYVQYTIDNKTKKSSIPNWKCKKEKQFMHLKLSNFSPLFLK